VLVLCGESIYPRTLVRCYPIGVIKMVDGGLLDEKIIAIPFGDPTYNSYYDIQELPKHIFDEMMHFFEVYKSLEYKKTAVKEICHRDEAMEIIAKCIDAYTATFVKGKKKIKK
jgi:inorganic pyrophosphatase